MERINYLSNVVMRHDTDEREIIKMEIMFLEVLSFADIDDHTLSVFLDEMLNIDFSRDVLTINRHRGIIAATRFVVEGR